MHSRPLAGALLLLAAATAALSGLGLPAPALAQGKPADKPSFDCAKARPASVDTLVCQTPLLGALDSEVARLYRLARWTASVRNSQKDWLRRRDACSGTSSELNCTRDAYLSRIVELRVSSKAARSADDKGISLGPVVYRCAGMEGRLFATFVNVVPALVRLRNRSSLWLMAQAPSASGARYVGPGGEDAQVFWTKGTESTLRLEPGGTPTVCREDADRD